MLLASHSITLLPDLGLTTYFMKPTSQLYIPQRKPHTHSGLHAHQRAYDLFFSQHLLLSLQFCPSSSFLDKGPWWRGWGQRLQDSSAPKCHLNSPYPRARPWHCGHALWARFTGVRSPGSTHTVVRSGRRGAKSIPLFCPWQDSAHRVMRRWGLSSVGQFPPPGTHSHPKCSLWTGSAWPTQGRAGPVLMPACTLHTPMISWVLSPGSWEDRLTHSHHCFSYRILAWFLVEPSQPRGWLALGSVTWVHTEQMFKLRCTGIRVLTEETGHVPQAQHTFNILCAAEHLFDF